MHRRQLPCKLCRLLTQRSQQVVAVCQLLRQQGIGLQAQRRGRVDGYEDMRVCSMSLLQAC